MQFTAYVGYYFCNKICWYNRASDVMRWCNFAQLTSCHIRSHNQRKNHIIAQCGDNGQFCKMYCNSNIVFDKKYSNILKSSSSNMVFTLCKYCSVVGRCIFKALWCFLLLFCYVYALQHDSTWSTFMAPKHNILRLRRPGNELDLLATWEDSKWRRILAW